MSPLWVTLWPSVNANVRGTRHQVEWHELAAKLRRSGQRAHDGTGWSPAIFHDDHRALDDVERVYAIGLDLDSGDCSADDAADLWSGHQAVVHSTKSSTPEVPRIRIVLALSRPVKVAEQQAVWRWAASKHEFVDHQLDRKTRDASRLWFMPSVPAEGEPVFIALDGEPIDVDRALAEAPPLEEDAAPEMSPPVNTTRASTDDKVRRARAYLDRIPGAETGKYGGTRTFVVAQKVGLGFDLDEETTFELLWHHFNRRCRPPWRARDLRRKVREAFANGRAIRRGQLLEQRGGRDV